MNLRGVLSNWELFAGSPQAVPRLRELILQLAVQGKLVPQDPRDEPASELLKKIKAEKERLVKEGKIKRDKPLAEITEEEKPFELPTGWEWAKGGDLFSVVRGVTYQKADAKDAPTEDHLPILRANNIRGSVNLDDLVYVPASLISEDQLLRLGDYVVCLASGSKSLVGKAAPFRGALACSFGAFCGVIRPILKTDYFSVYLASPLYRDLVSEASAGIGINNLKGTSLLDLDIALPPLAEQSRIVTRVQELMQLCDALEAKVTLEAQQHETLLRTLLATLTQSASSEDLAQNWQRVSDHFPLLLDRVEAIDALEQTILQLAVRGLLVPQNPSDEPASQLLKKIRTEKDKLIQEGKIKRDKPLPAIAEDEQPFELPTGWEWASVGSVGVTQTGGTPASSRAEYFDGNIPFIGPGQIAPNGSMLPAAKFISQLGSLESSVAEVDDILMVCIGGSIGKCAKAAYVTAFNQQINSIHPVFIPSEYLLCAMSSVDFVNLVISASTGSATPIINKGKWDMLPIPLSPLPEQHRIVTRVTELRQLCAALRARLAQSSQIQAQLAQALVQSSHD